MARPRSSRSRAAGLRSRTEIPAQSAAGPARAAAELDHDRPPPSRYIARKLSEVGAGPRDGDGPECRRPRASARGAAGAVAAAAQQCHRLRHSLLSDQPAGAGDRTEMGAPSAPRAEEFAPCAGRLQGTDAIQRRGGGMAGAFRRWLAHHPGHGPGIAAGRWRNYRYTDQLWRQLWHLAGAPRSSPIGIGHSDPSSRIGTAWEPRGGTRKTWPRITWPSAPRRA